MIQEWTLLGVAEGSRVGRIMQSISTMIIVEWMYFPPAAAITIKSHVIPSTFFLLFFFFCCSAADQEAGIPQIPNIQPLNFGNGLKRIDVGWSSDFTWSLLECSPVLDGHRGGDCTMARTDAQAIYIRSGNNYCLCCTTIVWLLAGPQRK